MYALRRTLDDKYVAKPGCAVSYTDRIDRIQIFKTKEDAEKACCIENEYIVDIDSLLKRSV